MIQHCKKTLHSRTKENRLVIQIQKALWRTLEPLFSRNKKALRFKRGQRKCACIRGQILPTRNNNYSKSMYVMTSQRETCRTFQSIICPAEKNNFTEISIILAWGKSRVGLPPPFIAIHIVRHIDQRVRVKGNPMVPKCSYANFPYVQCSETLIISCSCAFLPLRFLSNWNFVFSNSNMYGRPFVSKLWHDICAVFSHVYLQSFLLYDIRAFFCHLYLRSFLLCGVFIPKYMTIFLQTRIYMRTKKLIYMRYKQACGIWGSQKVVV